MRIDGMSVPASPITDEAQLDDLLSRPTGRLVETMRGISGDIIVLGVAGKLGPTLARMALRAAREAGNQCQVIGVARFSNAAVQRRLDEWGIETITADLLDRRQLDALPDAPNVVFLAGMKFGSTGNQAATWAVNAFMPGMVCLRYRNSRIVALSTGNVYGLTPVAAGGSRETDPTDPAGEYAMSCVGRERIFEYFSRTNGIPVSLIRLNYAVELRYGVLLDIAQRIWSGQPVDMTMGHVNVIWQADANAMALEALARVSSPPAIFNVTGDILSIREIAEEFARRLSRPLLVEGSEAADALLSNPAATHAQLGRPETPVPQMLAWVAEWVQRGGLTYSKPTKFENRDGRF